MAYEQLKLENQLCFRLYTVSRLVIQAYRPYLEPLGITYPQYLVLMLLWEEDKQLVNNIAHRLFLETNTVTPLIQRMEKQGLVKRQRGKEDKRQQIVTLTDSGRQMEEKAYALIPEGMRREMSACPFNVDDYTRLAHDLDTIITTMRKRKD
jgi:DNA-binding MarR family transcriptional regulator